MFGRSSAKINIFDSTVYKVLEWYKKHIIANLEGYCGSEGLKTAKITVNGRYLSWRYLANFETVLRTSSRFFEVFT